MKQSRTRFESPMASSLKRIGRILSLFALMLLVQTEVSGQVTIDNGTTCADMKIKIYWSSTNCPGTTPLATTCCTIIAGSSTVCAAPNPTQNKVAKVEFYCGSSCVTTNPWIGWPGCGTSVPPQSFTCCGRSLWIQGSIEKRSFRIDLQ